MFTFVLSGTKKKNRFSRSLIPSVNPDVSFEECLTYCRAVVGEVRNAKAQRNGFSPLCCFFFLLHLFFFGFDIYRGIFGAQIAKV